VVVHDWNPSTQRWKQEDWEFEASLCNLVRTVSKLEDTITIIINNGNWHPTAVQGSPHMVSIPPVALRSSSPLSPNALLYPSSLLCLSPP
jgi:hypothetical protein